jgi:hypothetical protein
VCSAITRASISVLLPELESLAPPTAFRLPTPLRLVALASRGHWDQGRGRLLLQALRTSLAANGPLSSSALSRSHRFDNLYWRPCGWAGASARRTPPQPGARQQQGRRAVRTGRAQRRHRAPYRAYFEVKVMEAGDTSGSSVDITKAFADHADARAQTRRAHAQGAAIHFRCLTKERRHLRGAMRPLSHVRGVMMRRHAPCGMRHARPASTALGHPLLPVMPHAPRVASICLGRSLAPQRPVSIKKGRTRAFLFG